MNWNPLTQTREMLRFMLEARTVFAAIVGISWFWFYGALFLSQFPGFAAVHLGGDERAVTLLLALFSVGIGAGSLLCGRLSRRRVDPRRDAGGDRAEHCSRSTSWWASPAGGGLGTRPGAGVLFAVPRCRRVVFDLAGLEVIGAQRVLRSLSLYAP